MSRAAIAEGQAHLVAGRLRQAQPVYHRVLEAEPHEPDALHLPGLERDDGGRRYAETASSRGIVDTPSYDRVTQPFYSRARGPWQRYHEPMAPILPLLLPRTERLGYDD